ncbi:HAD family hydrolase [Rubrobacter indicoceani]|uniref:HAD family hydrolase n=1 Tax=Rubrobacter indicoceani TaxID=2051957 RepID=UPI000E5ACFFF|nr:HAD family hydrolase [Rubrobacter indicoceani]
MDNKKELGAVKAVILDVDGTLMDTNYLHVEAWARAFDKVGERPTRAHIHREVGKGSDKLIPTLVQNGDVTDHINDLYKEIYSELQKQAHPLPGAEDLLAHLAESGYAVWLATSAGQEEMEFTLEELDAEGRISGVVSSSEAESSKPAPDIFDLTLEKAGLSAHEAVAVGDSIWDVQAAGDAGIQTIAVMTGGAFSRAEFEEAGAAAVFEDCTELLESGIFEAAGGS